jgi:hypothetical protein
MPRAWLRENNPAFTKLTSITVTADEDWITPVTINPAVIAFNLFEAIFDKIALSLLPENRCRLSLISFMPKRKSVREPSMVRIIIIVSRFLII